MPMKEVNLRGTRRVKSNQKPNKPANRGGMELREHKLAAPERQQADEVYV